MLFLIGWHREALYKSYVATAAILAIVYKLLKYVMYLIQGNVTCRAEIGGRIINNRSERFAVMTPPKVFVRPLTVTVFRKEAVVLNCRVIGGGGGVETIGTAVITWYRDNISIPENGNFVYFRENTQIRQSRQAFMANAYYAVT